MASSFGTPPARARLRVIGAMNSRLGMSRPPMRPGVRSVVVDMGMTVVQGLAILSDPRFRSSICDFWMSPHPPYSPYPPHPPYNARHGQGVTDRQRHCAHGG